MRQGSRKDGTNPRALGTNPRALGMNPRALRNSPKVVMKISQTEIDKILQDIKDINAAKS